MYKIMLADDEGIVIDSLKFILEKEFGNDIEIDFLISTGGRLKYKIYPIEVKSGKKYSIESLKRFKEKYKTRIGECYVIHPRNLSFKEDIVCIPPYMTICL